ncbi:MAG: UvrB/UvrC motif-containing protein [Eubacteriales bacterium]|nr:UvrB/UvrC motif-containing protein [Eubacteriales bacterium]MDD4716791.1 UvrB/UvrC motif-containing protein [Eubacteriales bacterium]
MKCSRCGVNEASIFIKQNINGKESEVSLCESCAKSIGAGGISFGGANILPVSIWQGSILSALDQISKGTNFNTGVFVPGKAVSLVCKDCGMTLAEFREKGKLGCSKCYDAFGQQLDQVFRRIQSGETHRGRRIAEEPESIEIRSAQEEIQSLKRKIIKAVENEDYESAAKYKVEIERISIRINEMRESEVLPNDDKTSEGGSV